MHGVCIMTCGIVALEIILIIKKDQIVIIVHYKKSWVTMFIVMDIINYIRFVPFFVDIYHVVICNKFNKRNIKQKIRPFYVLINN